MSARINLFAALAGAIWGGVWMVIVGVMLMMVSGVIVSPPVGIAALAGLVQAVVLMAFPG